MRRTVGRVSLLLALVLCVVGVATAVSVLALITERWLGLLVSLGVIGFGLTFALQQPLFSLIGWTYIVVKQPCRVGDRVRIEDARGDVADVDFLVTTLWESGGELAANVQRYRQVLDETPLELEDRERPSVNVVRQESWVELRLRNLAHPKRGQAVRNELYERILERFNEHPDRVGFPVSRNR